jgi:hypothetical protein
MKKFNLNSKIKVKLKEKGFQILCDNYNSFAEYYPQQCKKRDVDFYKNQPNKNGYIVFTMWGIYAIVWKIYPDWQCSLRNHHFN